MEERGISKPKTNLFCVARARVCKGLMRLSWSVLWIAGCATVSPYPPAFPPPTTGLELRPQVSQAPAGANSAIGTAAGRRPDRWYPTREAAGAPETPLFSQERPINLRSGPHAGERSAAGSAAVADGLGGLRGEGRFGTMDWIGLW